MITKRKVISIETRLAAVQYSNVRSLEDTAKQFNVSTSSISRWRRMYDGTLESLRDKKPKRTRRTDRLNRWQRRNLTKLLSRKNPDGRLRNTLAYAWLWCLRNGIVLSYQTLSRLVNDLIGCIKRLNKRPHKENHTHKKYHREKIPGMKVQIDKMEINKD